MAIDRRVRRATHAPAHGRRRQRGQSLLEFVIVVPAFLFLLLAAFQFMLIYRAKATLDYAALEAARAGAVHGADIDQIRRGLIRGITPLYVDAPGMGGAPEGRLPSGSRMKARMSRITTAPCRSRVRRW